MPIKTLKTCDICGDEVENNCLQYQAKYGKILYYVSIPLKVGRRGPVNSVSEPIGKMHSDYLCKKCILNIITEDMHDIV